ncbi:CPBP family intramembrane metalloprotease [Halonotius terrestris]|uniref:CPBP family intramembrane metalloprotease n=1 Tax=Halonotius terrestris TaxID=2487750 RepID=A0A8J8P7T1_9EURY|nr:type II CAAX endopeptidase family protein [Halonotius terrestris]TQQ81250.1 CPBP family intramembrane metalloprotease [Halonotius terrestris]
MVPDSDSSAESAAAATEATDAAEARDATDDRGPQLGHLAEAVGVLLGAYLFASIAVTALDPAVSGLDVIPGTDNDTGILRTAIQFVGLIVVVIWYDRFVREGLLRAVVPDRRAAALIGGGIVTLVAANYGISGLFSRLGFDSGTNAAVAAGAGDPTYFLVMVLISILLVGPAEELLFRGAVQGRLRDSWGAWPSILAATVLFGAVHAPAVSGGRAAVLSAVVIATILGVLLGYLYERTDNIVVPAVVHGVNNAVIFGGLYLREIGVL